jgi:hypothetical protein
LSNPDARSGLSSIVAGMALFITKEVSAQTEGDLRRPE